MSDSECNEYTYNIDNHDVYFNISMCDVSIDGEDLDSITSEIFAKLSNLLSDGETILYDPTSEDQQSTFYDLLDRCGDEESDCIIKSDASYDLTTDQSLESVLTDVENININSVSIIGACSFVNNQANYLKPDDEPFFKIWFQTIGGRTFTAVVNSTRSKFWIINENNKTCHQIVLKDFSQLDCYLIKAAIDNSINNNVNKTILTINIV